jgi:hypothetical protein
MPLYYLSIQNGPFAGACGQGFRLADRNAAWTEMTNVCGDLIGSVCRNIKQNADWKIELLDDSRTPVFRIRLVAETPGPSP